MKITGDDALYAVKSLYPQASKAREITSGYSHQIFEIETDGFPETIILRTGDKKSPKFCLAKEIRTIQLLEKQGIPVPRVILHDDSKQRAPFEFIITSRLPGEDLNSVWPKMTKSEQEKIATKIGELLGKIHTIKFDTYGMVTPNGIHEGIEFTLKKVGKEVGSNPALARVLSDAFNDAGELLSLSATDATLIKKTLFYLIDNKNIIATEEQPSLIHGDFEYRNIRVKKIKSEWHITGLLDFELAASHLREFDFIKLHRSGFLAIPHVRKSLLEGYTRYQKITPEFDQRVAYLRLGRDIGFAMVLLQAGDTKTAEKILAYIEEKVNKPISS